MNDLIISGGSIVDGSGEPAFTADIAVSNGVISDIGDLAGCDAKQTIDASGKIVCPGFIDVHSHSDTYILIEPGAQSKLTQGITTEIVGNCGASAAPRIGAARMPSDWAAMEYPAKWSTVAEYRSLVDQASPAVNIALLVGHNTLRGGCEGYDDIAMTSDRLRDMSCALEQALDEGACGLSTGLLYAPGIFAGEDEVVALCQTAASKDRIYTTHMRNESGKVVEALEETLRIAKASGVRTQVSHLKAAGKNNWHLIERLFELIDAARDGGMEVAADRYPYLAGCTDLDVVLPEWAQEGTHDEILERLHDTASRDRLISDLKASRDDADWNNVTVGSVTDPTLRRFKGTPLAKVAEEMEMHPAEAVVEIVSRDKLRTSAFFFGLSEENMLKVLAQPWVMVGSDASLRTTSGVLSQDFPHPRAFGSFPKYLRLVLDQGFLELPEAVRKVTSLPAEQFRLKNRGLLTKSYAADIVVFAP